MRRGGTKGQADGRVKQGNKTTASFPAEDPQYRELVHNVNSIIYRRDPGGRITFFNAYAQAFFGYGEAEILGKHVVGTIVPETDSSGRNLAHMIDAISGDPDRFASNINENRRRNGDRVWVAWSNRALRDEKGDVTEILCVGNDITFLEKRRRNLLAMEELYRVYTENVNEIIWTADLDLKILYVSPAVKRVLGYDRNDLLEKGLCEGILLTESEEGFRDFVEKYRRARRQGREGAFFSDLTSIELPMKRKDGSPVWTETTVNLIESRGEQEKFILAVTRDVTDRKKAEEERWQEQNRYHLVFDASPVGICYYDAGLRFVDCNPAFAKICQVQKGAFLGAGLNQAGNPDLTRALRDALEGRNGFFEGPHMVENPETDVQISVKTSPVRDREGNIIGGMSIVEDVTERVTLKRELEFKAFTVEDTNTALRILIDRATEERQEIEENMALNVRELILPLVDRIRAQSSREGREACLKVLESNLKSITSSFVRNMSLKSRRLTPKELHVANLVKEGKSTKEIAGMLNLSSRSVEFHRDNLRKKLGIKNSKVNLQSVLQFMS